MEFLGSIYQFIPHVLEKRKVTLRAAKNKTLTHEAAGTQISVREITGVISNSKLQMNGSNLELYVELEDGTKISGITPDTIMELDFFKAQNKVIEKIIEVPKEVIVEKPIEKKVVVEKKVFVDKPDEVRQRVVLFVYDELLFDLSDSTTKTLKIGMLLENIKPEEINFSFPELTGGVTPIEVSYSSQTNKNGERNCFDFFITLKNEQSHSGKYETCELLVQLNGDTKSSLPIAVKT